ncbi:metallophosphoesterase family protein [Paenibacillus sacheonensis]|uniref:metallophosphoesterase family protein n=1 Tax=Paenibacillus sacheonensis TaxID=742054 RepID=UPI001EF82686|nr:metallophosphoesterase family protein [Paenibacillus sacheonensis]MBM7568832.1 putative phosphodiesterase [Paenibacillus sacheonensis]
MKRRLVISDIHGCYQAFNQLLDRVNYHPSSDQLILLGDFVDRGPQSREVVEQVLHMVIEDGAIAIQGNHDERFADVVRGKKQEAESKFYEHGGQATLSSYASEDASLPQFRETVLGGTAIMLPSWSSCPITMKMKTLSTYMRA